VLQEREVTRVGGSKPKKINCRILVATHRNLLEEVKTKNFREDLYYRLLGLPIQLPALRERGSDIILLARHFIAKFCNDNKFDVKELSRTAGEKLMFYNYPGNIRELKSVVELSVVMSSGSTIEAEDIILNSADPIAVEEEVTLDEYNRRIIQFYLSKYDNNISVVAGKLNIGRSTIY
jgi:DNA-binding NtrC family response regulator